MRSEIRDTEGILRKGRFDIAPYLSAILAVFDRQVECSSPSLTCPQCCLSCRYAFKQIHDLR